MHSKRHIFIVLVAVVVAAFISLYPVMDCEDHGCPSAVHSALGTAATACVAAVLSAVPFLASGASGSLSLLRFGHVAMYSQTALTVPFRPPKRYVISGSK